MKPIVTTLLLAVLVLAAGAIAFIYSGLYNVSAAAPHGAVMSWIIETTMHASIDRRADGIEVPDLSSDSLLLAGVNDFQAMCVPCHGAPGERPSALGDGLNPPPPDLAESAKEMTAAELFWVTKHGIKMTGMPAWGKSHEDHELWPVVALIEDLPQLDAASYADLLDRAEGTGHHGGDAAGDEHPPASEGEGRETDEHGEPADAERPAEAEHDHSTHEH